MPISLVLDTNVLRQEGLTGLTSRNMQLLSRLTSSEEVHLFVPEIVVREFKSQRLSEVRTQGDKIQTAMAEMSRQVDVKGPTHGELIAMKTRVAELKKAAEEEVEEDLSAWIESSSARMIDFDPAVMPAVLDDYFVGAGAFRRPKHREDIPDAIVSAGVRSLLATCERVHIAVKDAALRRHLQVESRYTLVDGLMEFFALAPVAAVLASLDAKEKDVAALKALFGSGPVQTRLTAFLRRATELLEDVYLEESDLVGLEVLGLNVLGVSLNYAEAKSIARVEYSEVSFIDRGCFSVGVVIHTRARIDYVAEFVDFQDLPESRRVEEWSMDGQGLCDLREVRDVALRGYLELTFDSGLTHDAVEAHTHYLCAEEPQITVSLEVRHAAVL